MIWIYLILNFILLVALITKIKIENTSYFKYVFCFLSNSSSSTSFYWLNSLFEVDGSDEDF